MWNASRVSLTETDAERPRYRPIGQYGVIGDCRTAALVGPDGSIDWCCLPHFDSPAVFCRLLDADKGGYFRVHPADRCSSTLEYVQGSNVLETLFSATTGTLRLVDFMPIRQRRLPPQVIRHLASSIPGMPFGLHAGYEREIGNDVAAAHRINRILTCLDGTIEVDIELKATFDFAQRQARIEPQALASGIGGAILSAGGRYLVFFLRFLPSNTGSAYAADVDISASGDTLRTRVSLEAGQRVAVVLNYARDVEEGRKLLDQLCDQDFDADLEETMHYWREWVSACTYSGPYQQAVLRSALTLKLCTFEPTGAIVAAPTTSLPESIGGVRNWDYRYTWLRDSVLTLGALGNLGYHNEARDYFHFLHDLHVRKADEFRIMYSIRGESDGALTEHELPHLEGYMGSHPVRIGNGAATQHQLDVYGEVADAAFHYAMFKGFRHGHRLLEPDRDTREITRLIADYVVENWHALDNGIWEIRGGQRAYVYSRAMCWVALDRACKLARRHNHEEHSERWNAAREAIQRDILEHGFSAELGTFTQAYDNNNLDSANLRLPLVGFLPLTDQRMRGTVDVVGKKLTGEQGLLFRYEPWDVRRDGNKSQAEEQVDRLPGTEGAFLACTFWLIMDLCHAGRIVEARDRFEKILSFGSPLGLFSEELDQQSGALLGNYPQAFTHIGLVNAAVTLQRAQEGRLSFNPDGQDL